LRWREIKTSCTPSIFRSGRQIAKHGLSG